MALQVRPGSRSKKIPTILDTESFTGYRVTAPGSTGGEAIDQQIPPMFLHRFTGFGHRKTPQPPRKTPHAPRKRASI